MINNFNTKFTTTFCFVSLVNRNMNETCCTFCIFFFTNWSQLCPSVICRYSVRKQGYAGMGVLPGHRCVGWCVNQHKQIGSDAEWVTAQDYNENRAAQTAEETKIRGLKSHRPVDVWLHVCMHTTTVYDWCFLKKKGSSPALKCLKKL